MALTHLIFFKFWAGIGGVQPPGSHTPFTTISAVGSDLIAVTAISPLEQDIQALASFNMLGTASYPLTQDVSANPSLIMAVEVK